MPALPSAEAAGRAHFNAAAALLIDAVDSIGPSCMRLLAACPNLDAAATIDFLERVAAVADAGLKCRAETLALMTGLYEAGVDING